MCGGSGRKIEPLPSRVRALCGGGQSPEPLKLGPAQSTGEESAALKCLPSLVWVQELTWGRGLVLL